MMNLLGESVLCNNFLELCVKLLEAGELTEFGIPSVCLCLLSVIKIIGCLLGQKHHSHKFAINGDISNGYA